MVVKEPHVTAERVDRGVHRGGLRPRPGRGASPYERADNKDALFLAVYEHGAARVRADQAVLADEERWRNLPPEELADQVVREIAAIFFRHAAFPRPGVLICGVHPEVNRRGSRYSQELGNLVTHLLMRIRDAIDHPDPQTAVRAAFNAVFSALIMRIAYGPAFNTPAVDDDTFLQTLSTMVRRYLFAPNGQAAFSRRWTGLSLRRQTPANGLGKHRP